MKKTLFFIAILLVTFSMNAQESVMVKEDKSVMSEKQGAKIEFEKKTIDYGEIAHNSDGNREFVFTNTGTEDLVIISAKGSCGCTVPVWPREPIAPGATSSIKVKYATNRVGAFRKTVTLKTNAANAESMQLVIKGKVLPGEGEAPVLNMKKTK